MTFLPIIERELRVRARRQATFWVRVAVGGFGALLCTMQLSFSTPATGASSVGQFTFLGLVTAAFLLCCGAFVLTADSISHERREGTLWLLYLTRVRGHDVLLGKLGAAGITGLCAIVVFLPVLMLPLLSGGVTGGEAFRKGLVLLNTLFVGLAAGLWGSARGEKWVASFRRALLLMMAVLILPPLFGFLTSNLPSWIQIATGFSPYTGLFAADDAKFAASPAEYWEALVMMHLLGWGLLWRANVVLRRNLAEPSPIARLAPVKNAQPEAWPMTPRRAAPLTRNSDPITWLLRRQRGLALAVWAGVAIGVSNWLILPFIFRLAPAGMALQAMMMPTWLVARVTEACLFTWVASRFFVEARRTGEMELLATTPHGATTLVSAQWTMLWRLFRWPIIVLLLPLVYQACSILAVRGTGLPDGWKLYYAISLALGGLGMWAYVVALGWVGMWFGLRARSQSAAIIWTVALVGLVPQLLSWVANILAAIVSRFMSSAVPVPFFLSSIVASLVTLAFYLWLIHRTRKLLSGDLRIAELQPLALSKSLADIRRDFAMAVRKARHWTPS